MHNGFISKDHLKQVLVDVQHFLIQHKTPKSSQPPQTPSIKLSAQLQQRLKQKLSHLHAADIAYILESLVTEDRHDVWMQIPVEQRGDILLSLSVQVRESMLADLPIDEMVNAADNLQSAEIGDLANLASSLPEQAVDLILQSLTAEQRTQLEDALS